MRAPLLLPAIAMLLGVVAEQHAAAFLPVVCAIGLAAAATATVLRAARSQLLACALGLVVGAIVSRAHGHPPMLLAESPTARYTATVVGDVQGEDDGTVRAPLALDGIGSVRATLHERVEAGDRVLVRGRLEPFDEPRNPGEPSQREIGRDDGFVGRLAGAVLLARAPPAVLDPRAWAARLRAAASRRIRAVVPEPSATILAGALWGERGALPDDLHDAFQATGTVHVLVTAGLHLGVVAALIVFLLGRIGWPRAAVCALALALIVAYAGFSGAHLPAQRAATMIGTALLARACGARVTSWNALALAALVVALLWPVSVTSASFALSFSCVAAIVLFAEPITELVPAAVPERLREAIALTCSTQLGTWPLTAAIFTTLAPYAVVANALVVPLVGMVLVGGIATLVLPGLAPLETLLLLTLERIVRTIAALPGARATLATPSVGALVLYDGAAVAAGLLLQRGRIVLATGLLALGCGCIALPSLVLGPHGLEIAQLDVGQGDAAVIRTPHDHVLLIDAGGELERGGGDESSAERVGKRIVLGYLQRAGIHRVDLLLLTHPHGDHVGACRPILDAMPVGAILDSGQSYSGRAYRDCMAAAHAHQVPVVVARPGMRWSSGDGVVLDVLAPTRPFLADTGDDVNENSIVAMLHYRRPDGREFRALFTGDAGEARESQLLASGVDLRADVLKVGHHGSPYASTPAFVAAVSPAVASISVGRHNTFGHPGASTLATLTRNRATIYRTDRCGALSLDVDAGTATTMLPCQSHD